MSMEFEWDEVKRHQNILKHGIDFEDVKTAFSQPMITKIDDREDYGEERQIGIGIMRDIIVVVAFTEPSDEITRIISARKAIKYEREKYDNQIKN